MGTKWGCGDSQSASPSALCHWLHSPQHKIQPDRGAGDPPDGRCRTGKAEEGALPCQELIRTAFQGKAEAVTFGVPLLLQAYPGLHDKPPLGPPEHQANFTGEQTTASGWSRSCLHGSSEARAHAEEVGLQSPHAHPCCPSPPQPATPLSAVTTVTFPGPEHEDSFSFQCLSWLLPPSPVHTP